MIGTSGSTRHDASCMELKRDDVVKTPTGELARVIHISRLTAFVAVAIEGLGDQVKPYLQSQLLKVDGLNCAQPIVSASH